MFLLKLLTGVNTIHLPDRLRIMAPSVVINNHAIVGGISLGKADPRRDFSGAPFILSVDTGFQEGRVIPKMSSAKFCHDDRSPWASLISCE